MQECFVNGERGTAHKEYQHRLVKILLMDVVPILGVGKSQSPCRLSLEPHRWLRNQGLSDFQTRMN